MTPEQLWDSLEPQTQEYERILKERESYGDVIINVNFNTAEDIQRVVEEVRAAQRTGRTIIIDSATVLLDPGLREALLNGMRRQSQNEKSTRRSAQMYGKDFYLPEPEPCEFYDPVIQEARPWPTPKHQAKPKNINKQHIRTSMRSVNRNR